MVRKLVEDLWREQHLNNGYDLVSTPHIGRAKLWETSGHLDFYQEYMYPRMEMEGNDYYVKPMNLPLPYQGSFSPRSGATESCRCGSPSWERSIASSASACCMGSCAFGGLHKTTHHLLHAGADGG